MHVQVYGHVHLGQEPDFAFLIFYPLSSNIHAFVQVGAKQMVARRSRSQTRGRQSVDR